MSQRPTSVMGHVDAFDTGVAGLELQARADGLGREYVEPLADLRSLVASLRRVLDDRATGEFPRLQRERERRDTPTDPEAQVPGKLVERRRRRGPNRDGER